MDKFLKSYNLLRLNDKTENLNRLNTGKDIKSAIKDFPTKKRLGPDSFTGQSYLTLKELIPIFLKLLRKTEEAEMLPNSFYKASISSATKPDKENYKKRKLQANIPNEHICKNPQQNISKLN